MNTSDSSTADWAVAQVCQTRATRRFDLAMDFYATGLGLPVLFRFESPGGRGAMLGLPDARCHIELLEVFEGDTAPPGRHNVLVLHMPEEAGRERIVARLSAMGASAVAPANPYWADRAVVFEDPEGWPVVLALGGGIGAAS